MSFYYSPSTGGFYRDDTHVVPKDAVPVTDKEHAALFAKPGTIAPGAGGRPILTPSPAINPQEQEARLRLAALDSFIPRGLEDAWAASGFDAKTLPKVQQERLAEKATLRKRLAGGQP